MVLVEKKQNPTNPHKPASYRMALDLRLLNTILENSTYPLPKIPTLVNHISKYPFYTTIDFCKAYWQILLPEEMQDVLTFTTPFGTFANRRLDFGLKTVAGRKIPEIQQQLLDCNKREHLEDTTSFLQKALFRCCQKAYKVKKSNNIKCHLVDTRHIKQREMRVIQKRANNTTSKEQKNQLLFSRKKALYNKLSLKAKRTSLKNFCTQTKDPYGIPYKAIVKDNIPLSEPE
ncbi:hypothetical protein AVEN_90251-1 [Araneus ventricosus]|uniref:Reverse transcriptase domain-containing protein n=1 Tax=Araneus ventricosus TaxID=182803 RepID=A0A4Y2G4B6_ARAVE|nr:hypothetical protein AVEN_90251-1 [Araneus ventricosus]